MPASSKAVSKKTPAKRGAATKPTTKTPVVTNPTGKKTPAPNNPVDEKPASTKPATKATSGWADMTPVIAKRAKEAAAKKAAATKPTTTKPTAKKSDTTKPAAKETADDAPDDKPAARITEPPLATTLAVIPKPETEMSKTEMVSALNNSLGEPLPTSDDDPLQKVAYVKRLYGLEQNVGKMLAIVQFRIGTVLLDLKTSLPHGDWTPFIEKHFPFHIRTARNYMRLADSIDERTAETTTITAIYCRLGITDGGLDSKILSGLDRIEKRYAALNKQALKLNRDLSGLISENSDHLIANKQLAIQAYRVVDNTERLLTRQRGLGSRF